MRIGKGNYYWHVRLSPDGWYVYSKKGTLGEARYIMSLVKGLRKLYSFSLKRARLYTNGRDGGDALMYTLMKDPAVSGWAA